MRSEKKSEGLEVFHVAFKMITRRQARSKCLKQTEPTQFAFAYNVESVCRFVCEASVDEELLYDAEYVADKPVEHQT